MKMLMLNVVDGSGEILANLSLDCGEGRYSISGNEEMLMLERAFMDPDAKNRDDRRVTFESNHERWMRLAATQYRLRNGIRAVLSEKND